jgi:hypothetical protein
MCLIFNDTLIIIILLLYLSLSLLFFYLENQKESDCKIEVGPLSINPKGNDDDEKNKKPWYKKKWVLMSIGILVMGILKYNDMLNDQTYYIVWTIIAKLIQANKKKKEHMKKSKKN